MTTMISNPGARGVCALSPIIAFSSWAPVLELHYTHTHIYSYTQKHVAIAHTYRKRRHRRKSQRGKAHSRIHRGPRERESRSNIAGRSTFSRITLGHDLSAIRLRIGCHQIPWVCMLSHARTRTHMCIRISTISRAGTADDVDCRKHCYVRRDVTSSAVNSSEMRRTNYNKQVNFYETFGSREMHRWDICRFNYSRNSDANVRQVIRRCFLLS